MMMFRFVILTCFAVVLGGCASPARVHQMVAATTSYDPASEQLSNGIVVSSVIGGDSTNPLWTSEISSRDFKLALEDSLRSAGLLGGLRAEAPFELEVSLRAVDQPMFGLDFTVTVSAMYTLIESSSRETVYEDVIHSSHTATFSDAALGVERLRIANEGAARKNIATFIRKLKSLRLPGGESAESDSSGSTPIGRSSTKPNSLIGQYSMKVENLARDQGCQLTGAADLLSKEGPIELYQISCRNVSPMLVRCEYQDCRFLN